MQVHNRHEDVQTSKQHVLGIKTSVTVTSALQSDYQYSMDNGIQQNCMSPKVTVI